MERSAGKASASTIPRRRSGGNAARFHRGLDISMRGRDCKCIRRSKNWRSGGHLFGWTTSAMRSIWIALVGKDTLLHLLHGMEFFFPNVALSFLENKSKLYYTRRLYYLLRFLALSFSPSPTSDTKITFTHKSVRAPPSAPAPLIPFLGWYFASSDLASLQSSRIYDVVCTNIVAFCLLSISDVNRYGSSRE